MILNLAAQLAERVVQHPITGARPALPSDGVDLATWRRGSYTPVSARVYFDGTTAATVTVPTGGTAGVELWGFKLGQWWLIASLHAGAAIPIAADALGATEHIEGIGGFDRLFIAGTLSAGTGVVQFVPLEVVL